MVSTCKFANLNYAKHDKSSLIMIMMSLMDIKAIWITLNCYIPNGLPTKT